MQQWCTRYRYLWIAFVAGLLAGNANILFAEEVNAFDSLKTSKQAFDKTVSPFLAKHCQSCHSAKRTEGDLDLSDLAVDMKTTTSAARWAMVVEKLATGEMPPDSRPRPAAADIKAVISWIQAEMKRAGKHLTRRETFANGNKVDHDNLFDSGFTAKFDSPTGLRRFSPEIYASLLNDVARRATGVGQPFTPATGHLFKDMGAPRLDEPTTVQLIRNAIQIATSQTQFKIEGGKIKGVFGTPREFLKLLDETKPLDEEAVTDAIRAQFRAVLLRQPSEDELRRFRALMFKNVEQAGRTTGVRYALAAVFLLPEAIFRSERGVGPVDEKGRIRLKPREIAFAISFTLTDRRPSNELLAAAEKGELDTREGVARAVQKILADPKRSPTRVLRFFQEYFDYEKAREVFQDPKENPDHDSRALVEDTDRLIEYILERDRDVLRELLTTTVSFVAYKSADQTKKRRAQQRAQFKAQKAKNPERYKNKTLKLAGKSVYLAYNLTDFPDQQPVDLPADQRSGILTQPAWLAAHAKSGENHAIFRGKWIRERLLGGVVPDLPITVDAVLPEAPHQSLRARMLVTRQNFCWKCHTYMNPVGLPFENFDFYGRHRRGEPVLDKDATAKNVDKRGKLQGPVYRDIDVDASGKIDHFDDPSVTGDVQNSIDMLHKLAKSKRVEQVFVRHAFRFFMGRNENLGDGPSLQRTHKAYVESNGSMKALIVGLLTSDSFLYRVPTMTANLQDSK